MNTIDLFFQPDTYWPASLTPDQLLTCIRGRERQRIARQIYAEQGFAGLNATLVKEGLSEEERSAWGGIGPWCLGGEYLPELEDGEVEIARISLASTTSDQVSVRARQDGTQIRYRIVGEYEEDESMRQQLPFDVSDDPLTLGRLMDMIEGARTSEDPYPGGILSSAWSMMQGCSQSPDEIVAFFSLSSAFYPQIEARYNILAQQWLEENMEAYDELN